MISTFLKSRIRMISFLAVLPIVTLGSFSIASDGAGANLLSDAQSRFETSATGWEPQGNTTTSQEVHSGIGGSGALLIRVDEKGPWPDATKTARVGTAQYAKGISAKANGEYRGSVFIRGFDGSTGKARCEIREYNGNKIIATHTNIAEVTITKNWSKLDCLAKLSKAAKQISLRIHISQAEYGNKYLVDDASLVNSSISSVTTKPVETTPLTTKAPTTTVPVPTTVAPVPTTPTPTVPTPGTSNKPDATNTGVKPGIKLEKTGTIVVTADGSVIENKEVTGMIQVKANNVTIRNVHVIGTGQDGIRMERGFNNLLMENIKITSVFTNGQKTTGGANAIYGEGSWTLKRGNISGFADGAKLHSNQRVEDSYFHSNVRVVDLKGRARHTDGLQTSGGSNIVIRNNHFESSHASDFAMGSNLMIQNEFAQVKNYTIEGNFFSGGNYSVYLNSSKSSHAPHENIVVRNNVWARNTTQYGLLYVGGSGNDFRFSGNTYDDGKPFDGTAFTK